MAGENEGAVDLFGEPWLEPKDPRGRKGHVFSREVAENVVLYRGGGASVEEVSTLVGLDAKTLRKYYSRQLRSGASAYRLVLLSRLNERSKAGNVSATKALLQQIGRGEAQAASEAVDRRATPKAAERLGKKEEQQAAAERVGGLYAPPPAPKLVVNNPR